MKIYACLLKQLEQQSISICRRVAFGDAASGASWVNILAGLCVFAVFAVKPSLWKQLEGTMQRKSKGKLGSIIQQDQPKYVKMLEVFQSQGQEETSRSTERLSLLNGRFCFPLSNT